MKEGAMLKRKIIGFLKTAIPVFGLIALFYIAWTTVGNFDGGSDEKAMQQLEDAVRRAAVSCYAAEGRYPGKLSYLEERYGLQLDDRFAVHYDVFASNLAPDVTVVTIPSQEEIWGLKQK